MTPPLRPLYRTRQLLDAINPRIRRSELEAARAFLGPRLMPLFLSMDRADQRHCLNVYRRLQAAGCTHSDALLAALLHDCGKASIHCPLSTIHSPTRLRLWHRIAYVLLQSLPPAALDRAARLSRGLERLRTHAERGALLAEAHGAPPEVVRLIRLDGRADDSRSRLLKAADDEA